MGNMAASLADLPAVHRTEDRCGGAEAEAREDEALRPLSVGTWCVREAGIDDRDAGDLEGSRRGALSAG
jgi:hypothetical protein